MIEPKIPSRFTIVAVIARFTLTAAAIALIPACASSGGFSEQAASSLPIEVKDSTGGRIASARAFESGDRLYVSGSFKRGMGSHIPAAAHVDVRLVDAGGRVIAEQQDDIDPVHPKLSSGRTGRHAYTASFPLADARRAAKIVIQYDRSSAKNHSN